MIAAYHTDSSFPLRPSVHRTSPAITPSTAEIPFVFGTNASGVVNATLAYAHAPNASTKEGDGDLDGLLIMIEGMDAFDGGGAMGASARAPSDRAHKDDASDGELDYDPYLPNRELEYDPYSG